MGYTLSTLEKTDSDKVDAITEDDVPEFKNISIENVKCSGAAIALRFQGLPQKPIHDITIRNSRFIAKESIEMAYCDKIQLEQVSITTPSKVENTDRKVLQNAWKYDKMKKLFKTAKHNVPLAIGILGHERWKIRS